MKVYVNSEMWLRGFGSLDGTQRPEKSRLFKSWMKDDVQVKDACRVEPGAKLERKSQTV